MSHIRPLTQDRQLPAPAQMSALEIKKNGLIQAANLIQAARIAAPWFNNGPGGKFP